LAFFFEGLFKNVYFIDGVMRDGVSYRVNKLPKVAHKDATKIIYSSRLKWNSEDMERKYKRDDEMQMNEGDELFFFLADAILKITSVQKKTN
jgi:hypothetical protein